MFHALTIERDRYVKSLFPNPPVRNSNRVRHGNCKVDLQYQIKRNVLVRNQGKSLPK